ncbi:Por secretion system C-terminal sorting domain-containing protein [Saccharicrinis carchari]|uniref:Por secretion system C-terminal sorting domain-containing protein n=1 Tax=Saccharicrinis carchari TaxID=1168039 RepID=A0A521DDA7_SACCC|nr:cellulase family glycosylhydrolase [Saccharicrinis carchari]SMO69626.1 Por secretion system C-terminal sorting domain-containing protein [Saccharicrinis carchari]
MKKVFLLIAFTGLTWLAKSQPVATAFEINERLGQGINMGNSFEGPTETAWGNPWKPEYFELMAELGFKHVRIPICWEPQERSMSNAPYTISTAFMNRIKEVVDKALEVKLMPIINLHHHSQFMADPVGQKDRFLALWKQISAMYKDYPDSLLFEVLNEPTDVLTPQLWNVRFAEALSVIRQTNPTRTVLMGVAEFGGLGGVPKLVIPNDDHLILSIHYYNPFHFTHQGAEWVGPETNAWLGTKWNNTEAERSTVVNEFSQAISIAAQNNIPINIGEFGAYRKADMSSRVKWTTYLARWFEEQGFSWTYWEFSAGYGIYNPATKTYHQELVDALLHNPMPPATPVIATTVYESDFSSGVDGWSLTLNGMAKGSLSDNNTALHLDITTKGTEAWHAQLIRQNINLEANQTYQLAITARSPSGRSATVSVGKDSDPWNSYSEYYSPLFSVNETTFTYSFKMGAAADPSARIAFDLGNQIGPVIISSIKLEKNNVANNPNPDPDDPNPSGKSTLISDSELLNGVTYMQTNWRSFDDNSDNGASTVTPKPDDGASFPMASEGANGTSKSAKISFALNKGGWEYNPFVGFGFSMNKDKSPYNLSGSTGVSFWHKGESCYLKIGISSVTIPGQEHMYNIPSNTGWTKISIPWTHFAQPSWATPIAFDNSKVIEFIWQKEGSTGQSGDIFIDEVKIEGLEFNTPISTSTNDFQFNQETINVYPNPAKDILVISGLSSKYSNVHIISINGSDVLISQPINSTDINTLNVSQLKKGLYFLRFTGNFGSESVIKFLKE